MPKPQKHSQDLPVYHFLLYLYLLLFPHYFILKLFPYGCFVFSFLFLCKASLENKNRLH